jgi:hypothetical protein
MRRDLESLSHAGFIEVIASNVLAERLQAASNPLALARVKVEEETEAYREEGLRPSTVNEVPEPAPEPEAPLHADDIDFGNGAGAGAGFHEDVRRTTV